MACSRCEYLTEQLKKMADDFYFAHERKNELQLENRTLRAKILSYQAKEKKVQDLIELLKGE